MSSSLASLLLSIFLLLTTTTTTSAVSSTTRIGVTYSPSQNIPAAEKVASTLSSLRISNVRLLDPSPSLLRTFSNTNISLLITIPNRHVPSFAANLSAPTLWLATHVIPYYPRARISVISLGDDVTSSSSVSAFPRDFDPAVTLLPAIRNLHLALHNFGISTISVSTSFTFSQIMTASFPPSTAEFHDPIGSLIIKPLLTFLYETNSYFLVNVYPYNVYILNSQIPIGYALFEEHQYNFRDDPTTGLRYGNLYDMMLDSVIAAMGLMGYENIPVIVTETGWPSSNRGVDIDYHLVEDSLGYAEMYLNGLVKHLRSGQGTPLRKEGALQAYIYQLFDGNRTVEHQDWGIMYNNMSMKYKINFSAAGQGIGGRGFWLLTVVLLILQGLEIAW